MSESKIVRSQILRGISSSSASTWEDQQSVRGEEHLRRSISSDHSPVLQHHFDSSPDTQAHMLDSSDDRKMKMCRVCGDRALSVNFNVVTCESCKAFFRRNALKPKAFRCPFSGVCEINVVSRKFCKKCRLRKCFEVGMMKEWIMSDEARLKKRDLINTNREKRRTVIMATAAKHGLDGVDADKLDSDMDISDGPPRNQAGGGFSTDDGYFSSERSNDEMVSAAKKDFTQPPSVVPHHQQLPQAPPPVVTGEPTLVIPKSALIEFAVQCRCPYKDLSLIIEDYAERYSQLHHHRKPGAGLLARDAILHQDLAQHLSKSTNCDCGYCAEYRSKIGAPSQHQATATAGVHLPTTLNDEPMSTAAVMAAAAAAAGTGNMLSFLAPSFGKYYHAVEYPSLGPNQSASTQRTPTGFQPSTQSMTNSSWTQNVASMPTIPLDISSQVYDMSNTIVHRPSTLSCPLPVKLVSSTTPTERQQGDDKEMAAEMTRLPTVGHSQAKAIIFGQQTSVLSYAGSGRFSKLPYTMMPKLQELLELKKTIVIPEEGTEKKAYREPIEYMSRIMAFNRLLECDRMTLLKVNRNLLSILHRIMFFDDFITQEGSFKNKSELELCEKYVNLIPSTWRQDECIMLISMAIALFTTNECQLVCKNAVEEQRQFYIELLRKYLEGLYKSGEVQTAQHALLDILHDMRFEKIERSTIGESMSASNGPTQIEAA